MTANWKDINKPPSPATAVTAAGSERPRHSATAGLLTYSWASGEGFVEGGLYCLATKYKHVLRFSGAGDMGIDVAGISLTINKRLEGVWDNYQCKHYDHAIRPGDVTG